MNKLSDTVLLRRDRFVILALLILLVTNLAITNRAHTHAITAHVSAIHAMADASLYAGHAVLATAMAADPKNAPLIAKAAGAWLPAEQDLPMLISVEKANMLANTGFSAAAGELSLTYAMASTVLGLLSFALCAYLALRVLTPPKRRAPADAETVHE